MYNKKKQKAKFKFRAELGIILGALVLMVTLSFVLRIPSEKEKFYTSFATVNTSTTLVKDHVFNEVDYKELTKKIENDGYTYVFFGSISNATTQTEIGNINTAAVSDGIEEILYFDSAFASEKDREDDESFDNSLKTKETALSKNVNEDVTSEFCLDFAPQLWVYLNGELVFNSNDFLNEDETTLELSWSAITARAFYFNLELRD